MRWVDSSTETLDAWRADWRPPACFLTQAVSEWLVWKGDLEGSDLDSAAPAAAWRDVEAAYAEWARAEGVAALVRCRHVAGQLILVACGGTAGHRLLQLDVVDRRLRHGQIVWTARQLLDSAELRDGVRWATAEASAKDTGGRPTLRGLADTIRTRRGVRACTVLPALARERLVPPDRSVDTWLAHVARNHEVTQLA